MTEDSYRRDIARLLKAKSDAEKKRAEAAGKAIALRRDAIRIASSITRSTSETPKRMKLRQVADKEKKAVDRDKAVAGYDGEIGRYARQIAAAEQNLARARAQRERRDDAAQRRRREAEARVRRTEEQGRKRQDDAAARRRREELAHARELSREAERRAALYSPRVPPDYIRRLPDVIKVLFVAANPRDQEQLYLDEEVRDVTQRIRASRYRDSIRIESIWAVRAHDLMDALNEHEPRIVHFSGHGSTADEIIFLDDAGNTKRVTKEAITATIATTADHVRLVVFNTCHSKGQAAAVTTFVDAAVGMTTTIGDEAARVFAAYFYAALGSGHSVRRAFDQAIAGLKLEGFAESDTPELFGRDGVDLDEIVLVRPDDPPSAALVA